MITFFIATLVSSLVTLSLMLAFKRYELSTGHVLLGARREGISRFSRRVAFLIGTALPHFFRYEAHRLYRALWSFVHTVLARLVVKVEYWLEGLLRNVQEKTSDNRSGEASAFLREVGEYKRKIAETGASNRIEE